MGTAGHRRQCPRVADLERGDRVSAGVLSQTVVFLHWPGARKTRGTMGQAAEIGHDVAVIDLVLHMYSRAPTRKRLAELWCVTRPVSRSSFFLTQPRKCGEKDRGFSHAPSPSGTRRAGAVSTPRRGPRRIAMRPNVSRPRSASNLRPPDPTAPRHPPPSIERTTGQSTRRTPRRSASRRDSSSSACTTRR